MKTIYCDIHNLSIIIYGKDEEHLFVDDNSEETIIFYDNQNKKYLKRTAIGKCDENCPTIKKIFAEDNFSIEFFLHNFAKEFNPIERLELAKEAPSFITELQYRNFAEIKTIRDYLYSQQKLMEEQVTKFNNLFLEQGINLENY